MPHISVAVYDDEDEVDETAAGRLVEQLAARCATTQIAFASFGVFPTEEDMLFLAPVVTPALLDLHATYHAMPPDVARYLPRLLPAGALGTPLHAFDARVDPDPPDCLAAIGCWSRSAACRRRREALQESRPLLNEGSENKNERLLAGEGR